MIFGLFCDPVEDPNERTEGFYLQMILEKLSQHVKQSEAFDFFRRSKVISNFITPHLSCELDKFQARPHPTGYFRWSPVCPRISYCIHAHITLSSSWHGLRPFRNQPPVEHHPTWTTRRFLLARTSNQPLQLVLANLQNKISVNVAADNSSLDSLSFAGLVCIQDQQMKLPPNNAKHDREFKFNPPTPDKTAPDQLSQSPADILISNGQLLPHTLLLQARQSQIASRTSSSSRIGRRMRCVIFPCRECHATNPIAKVTSKQGERK